MIAHKKINNDLHIFLLVITGLLIIGGIFIYSASSVYALEAFGSSLYFVRKQIIGFIVGMAALVIACIIPIEYIKKMTPLMLIGATVLTALTLVPQLALKVHGSNRWLNLGRFAFQPSELLKITAILYGAYFIDKNMHKTSSFVQVVPLLIMIGIPSLVLLKQPDFGMTVTLIITVLMMLFIAQLNDKLLLISAGISIPAGILLIIMKPYRLQRILTFLNPWQDPRGGGFQIIQSLIAIGSGGLTGVGIGHSKQKFFYLPMQHTDFIFSIIAEETGFIGSMFLIILFVTLLYCGMRIAWQLRTPFAMFATLGFIMLISLQAIMNIAVATGLAPTKGLGLPFVSYGNSALVCNLYMVGLIINMVHAVHQK